MTPAQRWRKWQTQRFPPSGAKKPLLDFLTDYARESAESALRCGVRGLPVEARDLQDLRAVVADLLEMGAAR